MPQRRLIKPKWRRLFKPICNIRAGRMILSIRNYSCLSQEREMIMPSASKPEITTFLFDVGGVLLEKLSDIDEQICRLLDLDLGAFRRAQEAVIATNQELPDLWKGLNTLVK